MSLGFLPVQQKAPLLEGLFGRIILATTYFPGALRPSIVGPGGLNYRVRNGNGWTPTGKITRKSVFGYQLSVIGSKQPSTDNR